jgi:hypothetical protein
MGTCLLSIASGNEANPAFIRYDLRPAYPCNKGKKSTPGFKAYALNSGVALILL